MKPRGDSKLKTLPDALQEQLYQVLRVSTIAKAAAWLDQEHGLKVSAGSLSQFFSWYPRQGWLKQAATFADTLQATVKKLPELRISADQAASVAQVAFELQAAQDRDPKLFAMLTKGKVTKAQLQLERERFEWSKREDWAKGLDALHQEIKDNPEALRHFEAMQAALRKGRS